MKMPPRTRRTNQLVARRRFSGLDGIIRTAELLTELVQEITKNLVTHYAGIRKRLAFCVEYCGGRLIHVVEFAERHIFLNRSVECATLNQRTYLCHFGRRQYGGNRAIHVASLLPLFLVLKQCFLNGIKLADLRGGSTILSGDLRVRVHGQREVAVD